MQHYQDLNRDLQHRSNKDLTQNVNVVNEVLATKEASEYDLSKKYGCLLKQLKFEVRARERAKEYLIDIDALLK